MTTKPYLPKRNAQAPQCPNALAVAVVRALNPAPGERPLLNISPIQRAILQFVLTYRSIHFVGPSTDEISRHIGKCKSNTSRYVHGLLDKGFLRADYSECNRVRIGSLHVPADVLARLPQE